MSRKIYNDGFIHVISGPMFAGKTEEMLRLLNRLKYAKIDYLIFKPIVDVRSKKSVMSRNGKSHDAVEVKWSYEILQYLQNNHICAKVIAIDEVQFFDVEIVDVCYTLALNGYHVIVSGLDKDFRGDPFGMMPQLMVYANKITKLTAICTQCGCEANYSQRLVNGKPADYNGELVLISDNEHYEARCLKHFKVPNRPTTNECLKFNEYCKKHQNIK